jgi:uncharacterized membrane protein YphA (DoxX/SURF4 family)
MAILPKVPLPELFLRFALALAFLYPPLAALSDPFSWIGYFPSFLVDLVSPYEVVLLHAFGVVEVVLAVWVLRGSNVRVPALLMALLLLLIILINPGQFPVLFRDLALALAALSLAFSHPVRSSEA